MKKILSLLSVFAISGTALPTTIAASSYEKQQNNLESNSENLIRNKRQSNAWASSLGGLADRGQRDPKGYSKFFNKVIKYTTVVGGVAVASSAVACEIAVEQIDN